MNGININKLSAGKQKVENFANEECHVLHVIKTLRLIFS